MNVIVRHARKADAKVIAAVHVETWQKAYKGQVPQHYLDSLDPKARQKSWAELLASPDILTLVAETKGEISEIVGFCSLVRSRDADASATTGEISTIYVLPSHWRRRVGHSLMRRTESIAKERGYNELTAWVLETNKLARGFYETIQFSQDGTRKLDTSLGVPLVMIRYRKTKLTRLSH